MKTLATPARCCLAALCLFTAREALAQNATTTEYGRSSATSGFLPHIPVAPYSNSFESTSGTTRGYWFRAPTSFAITGLRVENEARQTKQSAALFVFSSPPTVWPTRHYTTKDELRFFAMDAQADVDLSFAPVLVREGDYVGVLGGGGDGTSPSVWASYSVGPMRSNVLGHNIVARRLLTENLLRDSVARGVGLGVATEGAGDGPCGRIRLLVLGQSSHGPAPQLESPRLPKLGTTAQLDMFAQIATTQVGVLLLGSGRLDYIPTPYGRLNITLPFELVIPIPSGTGRFDLAIPLDDRLRGVVVNWQAVALDFVTPAHGMSNGIEWRIGS